jgi:hypothetical protein
VDKHPEQARHFGNFHDQHANSGSCFCQPLHSGCDPKFYDKAISAPSSEWIENCGPLRMLEIDGDWEKGAAEGCMTCAAILGGAKEIWTLCEQDHHGCDPSGRNTVIPASIIVSREPGQFNLRQSSSQHTVQLFRKPDVCGFLFPPGSFQAG